MPREVEDHEARSDYILTKVVENVADDVPDAEYESKTMIDLSVKLTDLVPAMDREAIATEMYAKEK